MSVAYESNPNCYGKFELRWIDVDLIDSLSIQPDGRAEDAKTKDLRRSIEQSGIVAPPIVYEKQTRYCLLDGHRRTHVVRQMGFKYILCLVLDASAHERAVAFFALNEQRPMGGNERIQAWAKAPSSQKGESLKAMRPNQAKQIEDLIEILGEDRVCELSLSGFSLASAAKACRSVVSWSVGFGIECPPKKKIVNWVVENQALRLIDTVSRNPTPKKCELIIRCIRDDRPYSGPRL